MKEITIPCPVCDGKTQAWNELKLFGEIDSKNYTCVNCQILFRHPAPDDIFLKNYYSKKYFRYGDRIEKACAQAQGHWILKHCQLLEEQGVCVDSSWGFSDHIGFRNGICHEYSMFNFVRGASSAVKQRPLSIMDHALLNKMSQAQAYQCATKIIQTCKRYGGDFVLLWHNSYFYKPKSRMLYKKIIEYAR